MLSNAANSRERVKSERGMKRISFSTQGQQRNAAARQADQQIMRTKGMKPRKAPDVYREDVFELPRGLLLAQQIALNAFD